MQLGLAVPSQVQPAGVGPSPAFGAAPQQLNVGGVLSFKPLSTVLAQEAAAAQARQAAQTSPVVLNLAALIRRDFDLAKQAKEDIERQMLEAVRSKRGEYTAEKLNEIRKQGGSEIYMMLFATKARQAKALLGDVLVGAGTEKPWTLSPTPKPDLPPEEVSQIMQGVFLQVQELEMSGVAVAVEDIRQALQDAKDRAEAQLMALARQEAARAEVELEDVLVEGNWLEALDEFIDDLTTFKTAILKGPVLQRVPTLEWVRGPDGTSTPSVTQKNRRTWTRVDPFMLYPAPWAKNTDDAFLIERHQLNPSDLSDMIGLPGYNESAIRAVLEQCGRGGLHQWLSIDMEKPRAEGRDVVSSVAQSDRIDALQYWGAVSGKMLREWGMPADQVPDTAKFYQVECWLIGAWVIKAVINQDPLGRRPYYTDGYSRVPGAFWHNSLFDLVRDCQDMCNAAARALANNLGIASGPQADVNVDRLAAGAEITEMYPWKIWQTTSDPMGSTAKAINFFQPQSNAQELMAVYEKFSIMADEYSGIPRYMAGVEGTPGAGRTASGLSMMIGNASKTIKQLIASIDQRVISLSVGRLYEQEVQRNPNMRGDLKIVARGAMSLTTREAAQVRRNEFLQFTANPIDLQIMGPEGRAALLREAAKTLQMNVDDIVPSKATIRQRQIAMAQAAPPPQPGGEQLMDGTPATDHFSPVAA